MKNIYKSGEYLDATAQTWHSEDSAWKSQQILNIIRKNNITPRKVVEIGCGAGQILNELSQSEDLQQCSFEGYDISPQAIDLCHKIPENKCTYYCQDLLEEIETETDLSDILLVIDVFEHIPDYLGFIEKCRSKATYKIYHIPLDIHVSSVLRNSFLKTRASIGHLHYFTADSALCTLRDTGHEILDYTYTDGSFGLFKQHPSFKKALANGFRWILARANLSFTARLLGGYSLLVLTK